LAVSRTTSRNPKTISLVASDLFFPKNEKMKKCFFERKKSGMFAPTFFWAETECFFKGLFQNENFENSFLICHFKNLFFYQKSVFISREKN